MTEKMPLSSLSYLTYGIIDYLLEQKCDVEESLRAMGYEAGLRLLEIHGFRREVHIPSLLYRLTYIFLPNIEESSRKIEKIRGEEDVYLLTDDDGVFGRFISVPPEWGDFSADSITCGIIQAVIAASGHSSDVAAYSSPTEERQSRVVFQIRIRRGEKDR
jgi:trafficking protein particle complex subunit 5